MIKMHEFIFIMEMRDTIKIGTSTLTIILIAAVNKNLRYLCIMKINKNKHIFSRSEKLFPIIFIYLSEMEKKLFLT